jgi:hypothetical protein
MIAKVRRFAAGESRAAGSGVVSMFGGKSLELIGLVGVAVGREFFKVLEEIG